MALRTRFAGGLGVSAIALAISAVALPSTAFAQDKTADEANADDAIVVTGFRASIDSSAAQKKSVSYTHLTLPTTSRV